jgi:DNA-binding transcriptional regulator of glucitol operon
VRSKYFSRRALALHLAVIVWVTISAVAGWWQVGRAVQGNSLSFLYSIEWPVIAVLGVLGWYALLNIEKVTESQAKEREEYEEMMRAEARAARAAQTQGEDPELSAYNDHLAKLSHVPKKRLWGH